MADRDAILKAILNTAGNPSTGSIRDMAPAMADAVAALDSPKGKAKYSPDKETRTTDAPETR